MPSHSSRPVPRGRVAASTTVLLALTLLGPGVPGATATAGPGQPEPAVTDVGTPATDRIVVRWKASATASGRASARAAAETRRTGGLGDRNFELLRVTPGTSVREALSALRADPRVAAADPDHFLTNFSVPDDPDLPRQWALQPDPPSPTSGSAPESGGIDVGPAWDRTVGSPDAVVAVIDGGYDFTVPDLASVAWTNPGETAGNGTDDDGNGYVDDVRGWDFVGRNAGQPVEDDDPSDDDPASGGHGAHVAGILGARGDDGQGISGVAQNVRIMPLRVCARAPLQGGNRCLLSAVVRAVNYAGRNGARVANLSLGGAAYDQTLVDAFAANPGTLFVVAAGNDGRDNEQHPVYPCSYQPVRDSTVAGRVDNVVCVAALDQRGRPASFSNWGAEDVDLAAPGVDIWSIYRQYRRAVVWSDDFEGDDLADRWSGSGFGLGAPGDGPLISTGLTDSPGAAPTAGEHHFVSEHFSVPAGAEYCEVQGERFARLAATEDFSYSVWREGAEGPTSFSLAVTWPKQGLKTFGTDLFDASELAGQRATLHVDYAAPEGLDETYGVWLDNLRVVCGAVVAPAPYALLSGTSMASPMVAGAAALLFSLKPSATPTQVRGALVGSARKSSAWAGRTVSGGRLDVAAAMGRLVPPDTRFARPVAVSGRNATLDVVQEGSLAPIRFQCRLDAGAWRSCNPSGTIRGLRPGRHVLLSRAVDLYGNADPTPASSSFTVAGCLVPPLKGRSLAYVQKVLPTVGCRFGRVVRPPGVAVRKLKVKSVSPGPGTYLPTGTRLTLVMVRR